jgi:beta-lactamase class A
VLLTLDRRNLLLSAAALALGTRLAHSAESAQGAIAQDVALLGAPDVELENKIGALANEAGLYAGFAAVDVAKGRTAFVRGGELFPMQSVYKLPIAVAFLRMVQKGDARLDTKTRLTTADIAPGRSPLARRLRTKPTTFTARQLLEHMLLNSDNTATDALLKIAGGPAKIQATIKDFGIDGLRVDRFERELQPQALGLDPNPAYAEFKALVAANDALGETKQKEALERYLRDRRDTASPRAVATLLVKVMSSHLIQPRMATLLLDLMRRTETGEDRLKGGLPAGWTFAHRGGTSLTVQGTTAAFNDAGLAANKKGAKFAIVLFIKNATLSTAELAQFNRAAARAVVEAWG